MADRYILNPTEYKKKMRDERRLEQLKDLIEKAHNITKHIKRKKDKGTDTKTSTLITT